MPSNRSSGLRPPLNAKTAEPNRSAANRGCALPFITPRMGLTFFAYEQHWGQNPLINLFRDALHASRWIEEFGLKASRSLRQTKQSLLLAEYSQSSSLLPSSPAPTTCAQSINGPRNSWLIHIKHLFLITNKRSGISAALRQHPYPKGA